MKKRIVEIRSIDKRYMNVSYPYRPMEDPKSNTWLTGQHIYEGHDDGLTTDEMIGKVALTPEKRKAYPYIINPLEVYPIWNRRKFDITTNEEGKPVNPKDYFEFIMYRDFSYNVAKSKRSVRPGYDLFYIHDVEEEAKATVSMEDLIYDATKYVREDCTMDRYKELALLLNYKIKNFHINVDGMTEVQVRARLYEACKKNPVEVLSCKEESSSDELFILKAVSYGIIKRMGDDFFDGGKFIGKGLKGVKTFMMYPDNQMYVGKWKSLIDDREGRTNISDKAKLKAREELRNQYEGLELDDLKKLCGSKKYKRADWEAFEDKKDVIEYLLNKLN